MQCRLFFLQALIPIYSALSLAVLLLVVDKWPVLQPAWNYLGLYEPFSGRNALRAGTAFISLYFVFPMVLMFPPTFMMGLSFPILQEVVQTNLSQLGRKVGLLQTANIIGSTLGAIFTGLILLATLGAAGTLKLLFCFGLLFGLLCLASLKKQANRLSMAVSLCVLAAVGIISLPSGTDFWSKMHGTLDPIVWAEDQTGLTVLKSSETSDGLSTCVYANGIGSSFLPYGQTHTSLGMLPAFLHPQPKDIAIIGLGSGDTCFSAGGRQETETVTCIEINQSEHTALTKLKEQKEYPALDKLFGDKRMKFEFADARKLIQHKDRLFDVVEADALRRNSAYAGNLYSVEYFTLLKKHLKPGGYAVTWVPSKRTRESFLSVFPYATIFGNCILVGSNKPIDVDGGKILQRVNSQFSQSYYSDTEIHATRLLSDLISSAEILNDGQIRVVSDKCAIHSDLFPRDEYMTGE